MINNRHIYPLLVGNIFWQWNSGNEMKAEDMDFDRTIWCLSECTGISFGDSSWMVHFKYQREFKKHAKTTYHYIEIWSSMVNIQCFPLNLWYRSSQHQSNRLCPEVGTLMYYYTLFRTGCCVFAPVLCNNVLHDCTGLYYDWQQKHLK